ADLPSRGCSVNQFIESRWWEGPAWLRKSEESWPVSHVCFNEQEISLEKKKNIISSLVCPSAQESDWFHSDRSDFDKIVRRLAWIIRFVKNCRLSKNERISDSDLSFEEVRNATNHIIRWIQLYSFDGCEDSRIKSQGAFKDSEGIIRLRSKVSHRRDTPDFCHPIILPSSKNALVAKIIQKYHSESQHAGVQTIMALIREKFWIIKTRQSVRRVISRCVICKRFTSRSFESTPAPLLENRVRDARVFEIVGVDLAGPLFLK